MAGEQTTMLRSPPAQRPEPRATAQAQAREIQELLEAGDLASLIDLRGRWRPGVEGADRELLSFREAARFLAAAQSAAGPHNRLEHLRRANAVLTTIGNQILQANDSPLAPFLPPALEVWKKFTRSRLAEAEHAAASQLPNPFRAGQPLRPDQGQAVFRGRESWYGRSNRFWPIRSKAGRSRCWVRGGAGRPRCCRCCRRCCPTACACSSTCTTTRSNRPGSFFEALHRQAREQAARDRRMTIPPPAGRAAV